MEENLGEEGSRINLLILTSFIFITNTVSSLYQEDWIYALLFALLTVTSLVVHSYDNFYSNVLDKIVIGLIAIYGGYVLWSKWEGSNPIVTALIISTFLFCIWVYICGYCRKNYCFCDEKCVADRYHSFMHLIGSLGHHLIVLM
jgi:glucan phosphoethanolaminetransferase (alkaline phosphatase superfamily)